MFQFKVHFMILGSVDVLEDLAGNVNQKFLTLERPREYCPLCRIAVESPGEMYNHRKTQRHRRNYHAGLYTARRFILLNNPYGLAITGNKSTPSNEPIVFEVQQRRASKLTLMISNTADPEDQVFVDGKKQGLVIKAIEFLVPDPEITLSDQHGITLPEQQREKSVVNGLRIFNGRSFKIELNAHRQSLDQTLLVLMVTFISETDQKMAYAAREILVQVSSDELNAIKPTAPFKKDKKRRNKFVIASEVIPGIQLEYLSKQCDFLRKWRPPKQKTPKDIVTLLKRGMQPFGGITEKQSALLMEIQALFEGPLTPFNYSRRFEIMLQAEEEQKNTDIMSYDMEVKGLVTVVAIYLGKFETFLLLLVLFKN